MAARERGDRWIGEYLSVDDSGVAHFHHADTLRASVAAADAADFAETSEEYKRAPDRFVVCWRWLIRHPIFHRPYPAAGAAGVLSELSIDALELAMNPTHIERRDGLRDMWMSVSEEGGEVIVALEHGPYLWPSDVAPGSYGEYSAGGAATHDPALDVSASSYEAAIVALAAKVREGYGFDRSKVQ